jgi:hypothetical protein
MLTLQRLLKLQSLPFDWFPKEAVTIEGTTYQALVDGNELGNEFGMGGKESQATIKVWLNRNDIVTMPVRGISAIYKSVTYKIDAVEQGDAGAPVELTLNKDRLIP